MNSPKFIEWKKWYEKTNPESFFTFNDNILYDIYLTGKRIKLISMNNDPHPVPSNTEGTIRHVDGIGQIHVNWDNGGTLAVVPEIDEYEILE